MKDILKDLSTYPHFEAIISFTRCPPFLLKPEKCNFNLNFTPPFCYSTVCPLSLTAQPLFFLRLLTRFFPVAIFVAGAPVRSVDVELGEDIVSA